MHIFIFSFICLSLAVAANTYSGIVKNHEENYKKMSDWHFESGNVELGVKYLDRYYGAMRFNNFFPVVSNGLIAFCVTFPTSYAMLTIFYIIIFGSYIIN